MEDSYQQISEEEKDESVHEKGNSNFGNGGFLDGYTGPRARLTLDSYRDSIFESISSNKDDNELGTLERIVSCLLSFGFLFAILLSLLIIPVTLIGYTIYSACKRIGSYLFSRKTR